MGFTYDIGQFNVDIVRVVAQSQIGDDAAADFVLWASDWCLAHDQNILVGICAGCGDDDSAKAYEAAACDYLASYAEVCTEN